VISLQKNMCLRSCASAISIVFVLSCGSVAVSHEAPAKTTPADQLLQEQVTDALESDRYFYSAHVNVSVRNGVIVLHGFVFSDWDLRDAIRIANRAADGNRVVNDLAIEVGGRR
jgi:osmotically-inducible protein OsmY